MIVHVISFAFLMVLASTAMLSPVLLYVFGLADLGWRWEHAAMFSAILASTDAVAVSAVLKSGVLHAMHARSVCSRFAILWYMVLLVLFAIAGQDSMTRKCLGCAATLSASAVAKFVNVRGVFGVYTDKQLDPPGRVKAIADTQRQALNGVTRAVEAWPTLLGARAQRARRSSCRS
jgi:hypothetical protein